MSGKVLTEKLILSKSKAASLAEVHNVNHWGGQFSDISIIAKLPNVDTISLSVNEIASLSTFSHCPKLRELYLRKNKIADLRELFALKDLKSLRVLWLSENPITNDPDYRDFAIAVLPQLTKLDEVDVTDEEKQQAKAKFPNPEANFRTPEVKSSSGSKKQNEVQAHILGAIEILLQDLDEAGLAVLADMVARRQKRK